MKDKFHLLPEHFQRRITICEETGCWICKGDPSSNGYQRLWYKNVRYMAHKIVHELLTGIMPPKGKQYDHLCERRDCCNPNHIDIVTPQVNIRREFRRRKRV